MLERAWKMSIGNGENAQNGHNWPGWTWLFSRFHYRWESLSFQLNNSWRTAFALLCTLHSAVIQSVSEVSAVFVQLFWNPFLLSLLLHPSPRQLKFENLQASQEKWKKRKNEEKRWRFKEIARKWRINNYSGRLILQEGNDEMQAEDQLYSTKYSALRFSQD